MKIVITVYSRISPYGRLHNTDTSIILTPPLHGRLHNTDTSIILTPPLHGRLHNTDTSLLRTVLLVPKTKNLYHPYLYNTSTSIMRTLRSALSVSVFRRFRCTMLHITCLTTALRKLQGMVVVAANSYSVVLDFFFH